MNVEPETCNGSPTYDMDRYHCTLDAGHFGPHVDEEADGPDNVWR